MNQFLKFVFGAFGLLVRGLWFLVHALLVAWATLAIYFSNLPWTPLRLVLAGIFLAFSVWAILLYRNLARQMAFAVLYLCVVAWWLTISPMHDRPWRPEVAIMPRVKIDGDHVHITGVRNFDYRSRTDFTEHWEERDYLLSHLTGLDFYVSYWSEGPVAHTFVSFVFDNASPLSISIETRPEVGEGFDPLASIFKQFELIYVVGDERDLVGVRANHRKEAVYLYHLNTSISDARQLLLVYLQRINELADRPEFYNLFTNSCTINIVRYANAAGRAGHFEFAHLLNGLVDNYLYRSGRINTAFRFEELRRRSLINEAALAADGAPDFSERIRISLPSEPPR